MAEQRISEARMSGRVKLVAGGFLVGPLPRGAGLAWVSAIVHQSSRQENRQLFSTVADALNDDGQILIRNVLMDNSRTSPVAGALFAIKLLVATEAGGTHTYGELRNYPEASGFEDTTVLRRDEGIKIDSFVETPFPLKSPHLALAPGPLFLRIWGCYG